MHEEDYKGYRISITPDEDPPNPLTDYDSFGHFFCWHGRYSLGHPEHPDGVNTPEDLQKWLKEKKAVWMPLFLYDHSGITMSTAPFSCPWDSGQVGVVAISREEILRQYNRRRMSGHLEDLVRQAMKSEVEVYDQYLRGDVYCYDIVALDDLDGGSEDSLCGCFGFDYCLQEAKGHVDYLVSEVSANVG